LHNHNDYFYNRQLDEKIKNDVSKKIMNLQEKHTANNGKGNNSKNVDNHDHNKISKENNIKK